MKCIKTQSDFLIELDIDFIVVNNLEYQYRALSLRQLWLFTSHYVAVNNSLAITRLIAANVVVAMWCQLIRSLLV